MYILQRMIKRIFRCHSAISTSPRVKLLQFRHYTAQPNRFYRKTGVVYNEGQFEIILDHRKLKTPKGSLLKVDSEPLALSIALEWDSQKEKIDRSSMHLTSLCSTVIDNPNNLTKYDLVQHVMSFLETDTTLCYACEDDLYQLQVQQWQPILRWFCNRYDVFLEETRDISGPTVNETTKNTVMKHLLSHNFAAVHGFSFAVESLKSLILALACVERHITVEKAVFLSRLEEEYQTGHWGRVEWAHDLNQQAIQARVAAAILFLHFNSSSTLMKSKHLVT